MPRKPVHDDATFLHAYRQTESARQLADRLGLHVTAILKRIRKLRAEGVDLPPQEVTP